MKTRRGEALILDVAKLARNLSSDSSFGNKAAFFFPFLKIYPSSSFSSLSVPPLGTVEENSRILTPRFIF